MGNVDVREDLAQTVSLSAHDAAAVLSENEERETMRKDGSRDKEGKGRDEE